MKRFYLFLIVSILVLLGGLSTGSVIFYRLFFALAGVMVLGVVWAYFNLHRLKVSVSRPHGHLKVGDALQSEITLKSDSVLPKWLLEVRDLTLMPGHTTARILSLRPYQTIKWVSKTVFRKRGVFTLGHLAVTSRDVFGIYKKEVVIPTDEQVVIYPAVVELPWFFVPQRGLVREGTRQQPTPVATPVASSVREYIYGDALKHIHWLSTARKGRLMAKQFDAGLENRAWVLLDLNKKVQAGDEIENTEEYAVTVAASVINKFLLDGWSVGFAAQGDEWYHISAQDNVPLERYLGMLAHVRASGDASIAALLASSQSFLPPPPFVLTLVTPDLSPDWISALGSMDSRGAMVNVVLVDPTSFGGKGDPSTFVDYFRSQGLVMYLVRKRDHLATVLDYRTAAARGTSLLGVGANG